METSPGCDNEEDKHENYYFWTIFRVHVLCNSDTVMTADMVMYGEGRVGCHPWAYNYIDEFQELAPRSIGLDRVALPCICKVH